MGSAKPPTMTKDDGRMRAPQLLSIDIPVFYEMKELRVPILYYTHVVPSSNYPESSDLCEVAEALSRRQQDLPTGDYCTEIS